MSEQSALGIDHASIGRSDAAAAIQNLALGRDPAGLRRNRSQQRNLELKRGLLVPLSRADWIANPMQLSSKVAVRPPWTVPAGLR